MTGGSKPKIPAAVASSKPAPAPAPQPIEEMIAAKDVTRQKAKKKGRSSTVFAGRLQQSILDFGKKKVGA